MSLIATCAHCTREFRLKPSLAGIRRFCSSQCYWASVRLSADQARELGLKVCARCRVEKTLGGFSPSKGNLDGASAWCKSCRSEDESKRRKTPVLIQRFHSKYESDMDFRARELLRAIEKRCRVRGLEFDLDVDWMASRLWAGACELTGLRFDMSVARRRSTAFSPTVDRIVAGGGYTKSNCRVVLNAVNTALMDWGLETFLPIAAALTDRQRRKAVA